MSINFGCQGSTWVLDYYEEADFMDQIIKDMKESGFKGGISNLNFQGSMKKILLHLKWNLIEEV